jgi:hypothetical protein
MRPAKVECPNQDDRRRFGPSETFVDLANDYPRVTRLPRRTCPRRSHPLDIIDLHFSHPGRPLQRIIVVPRTLWKLRPAKCLTTSVITASLRTVANRILYGCAGSWHLPQTSGGSPNHRRSNMMCFAGSTNLSVPRSSCQGVAKVYHRNPASSTSSLRMAMDLSWSFDTCTALRLSRISPSLRPDSRLRRACLST